MKVSLIVAAYNVEKYIERCIDSLVNQTYANIEIIIVNDASTDSTRSICENFGVYDNVMLINKAVNEGLSEARNTGIEAARGDYLTFIDGDDFIEHDTVEKCVNVIRKYNVDELVYASVFDKKNGDTHVMNICSSKELFLGKEDMQVYFNESIGSLPNCKVDRDIGITPWGRIYRREILIRNNLRFISERKYIYEDLTFFLLSTPHIDSVAVLNEPFYHYCENDGSLTQKCDLERFYKVKKMASYIRELYCESFDNKETLLRFKRLMLSYIRLSIMQIVNCDNKKMINKVCKDEFTYEIIKNYPVYKLPIKQRIFTYLIKYKMSVLLYYLCKYYPGG